ncbi:MAG TPA: TrkA family potassium uptake protein [Pirellulaceae bacterium]|nr:TrkA family potassium uptake protein [Pirellulaceae bacterium]
MADNRRFIVLGLGSFGTALATRLCNNGCRVTGVDEDADRVEELKHLLYEAVIADVTETGTLKELHLESAHAVFISLGEDITPSLLCALHAREVGAKRIIVKGITQDHAKLLKSLGVERVIFPEIEIATELADRMTWPNVLDFMPIDPEYSFAEITCPASLCDRTLREANLRKGMGISVVGVKDALSGKLHMFPDGEFRLSDDQLLVVVGRQQELAKLRELK